MNIENTSTKKYWLYFMISMVAMIAFLILLPEWFWVMLPFVGTSFVYAMDWT
jgi:hypothetical protein